MASASILVDGSSFETSAQPFAAMVDIHPTSFGEIMFMHVKAPHLLASAVVAATFFFPAQAQYTGPSGNSQATVAEILKNPVDDQGVQIQGNLLRKTSEKKYIFSDGTGEIVAEIKTKHFAGQSVDEATKVELIGEVDTGRNRPPEIEVKSVRVVKQERRGPG